MKLSGILLFLILSLVGLAQPENVIIKETKSYSVTFNQISYLPAGDSVITLQDAQHYLVTGKFIDNKKKYLNLGIASDNYWVVLSLINRTNKFQDLLLNLENPRLNEVDVWLIRNEEQISQLKLGDNYVFSLRPVYFNQFAIPLKLQKSDSVKIFMLIKHKGNTLQLPITLHTVNSFLKNAEKNYLVTGIATGILLLTIFISLFLYFKTTNSIFIFYAFYTLSVLLWLISTEGYGFQFLWPRHPQWATRFGPGFSVFNLTFFIAVAIQFTKSYDNTKWIRIILKGSVIATFIWGLQAFMPYIDISQTSVMSFFLKGSYLVYGVSLTAIFFYLLYVSIKKNKIVFYYLFSVIAGIISSLLIILKNNGAIDFPFNSGEMASVGVVLEIILMTLGIATQFYNYKKEKEAMLKEYILQQKLITEKVLAMQESERKRISREMHDDIGAGLTQITLMSESLSNNPAYNSNKELDDIRFTSRKLVESMSEIVWSMNPDNKSLGQLTSYLREQLHKQLEYSGMEYTIQLQDALPEIQLTNEQRRNIVLVTKEIVNNAIKHSEAKYISIKGEVVANHLSFSIADNGIGLKGHQKKSGNGLRNIKGRIEAVGGNLKVDSSEKGSLFNYSIPLSITT